MATENKFHENDELCMRFTVWLKVVVKRAKIDYIRRQKRQYIEVSIEEIAVANLLVYEQKFDVVEENAGFEFENEKVAMAFAELSPRKRQILIMLFVEKFTSEEIAKKLKCTLQYVYSQRSLALKELRRILNKEG